MDCVNERSTWFTTVSFTDENGDPVVPESAQYRIDDCGTDEEVRGDTAIAPLGTSSSVMWGPADTSILDEARPYETRRLTVSWTYSTSASPSAQAEGHSEYLLNVINLKGVATPSPA